MTNHEIISEARLLLFVEHYHTLISKKLTPGSDTSKSKLLVNSMRNVLKDHVRICWSRYNLPACMVLLRDVFEDPGKELPCGKTLEKCKKGYPACVLLYMNNLYSLHKK